MKGRAGKYGILLWASGAAFALLSAAAGAGWLLGLDLLALRVAQARPAAYLDGIGALFSFLGSIEFTVGFLGLLVLWVFVRGDRRLAARLVVAFAAAALVEVLMKLYLPVPPIPEDAARIRDFGPLVDTVYPYPYPSGHSIRTTFLLVALCLLWRNRFVWSLCAVLLVLMAASRVYLGVHWASDVAGGALLGLAGLAWALKEPSAISGQPSARNLYGRRNGSRRTGRDASRGP